MLGSRGSGELIRYKSVRSEDLPPEQEESAASEPPFFARKKKRAAEIVTMALITVAVIVGISGVVIFVDSITRTATESVSARTQPRRALLRPPGTCPGGQRAAAVQNGYDTSPASDDKVFLQIGSELSEKTWESDFNGDGDTSDVIPRIGSAAPTSSTPGGIYLFRAQTGYANAPASERISSGINLAWTGASMPPAGETKLGLYNRTGQQTNTTATPNIDTHYIYSTGYEREVNTKTVRDDFEWNSSIHVNRSLGCWTLRTY